jgi:hypothetical protein
MTPQSPDEPFSLFDDPELEAVFSRSSPADTLAAVLTEARVVLSEIDNPLDAELWGSDIVAALGSGSDPAEAIVPATERAGTPEAMATLLVLAAVASGSLRGAARAAADRLAAAGVSEPSWAEGLGAPTPGQCWCYGDTRGQLEAVTMSFWYGDQGHVVSVLLDRDQGVGRRPRAHQENVRDRPQGDLRDDHPGRRAGTDGPGDRRGRVPPASGGGRQRRLAAGDPARPDGAAQALAGARIELTRCFCLLAATLVVRE